MPRFSSFPSPKSRQNTAHIYVPSHLTFIVPRLWDLHTSRTSLCSSIGWPWWVSSFFIYIACPFWRLLIWEMCITFYSQQKKMGQLLFILGSTLDLRSQEIRQKRLRNVMCSSNVSKNQPISPHHVLLQKSSATTAMSFIWQIFNLDMWMCSLRENQLIPKLMMFRSYSSTQPIMLMIIHRLFNVIHWTLQN